MIFLNESFIFMNGLQEEKSALRHNLKYLSGICLKMKTNSKLLVSK